MVSDASKVLLEVRGIRRIQLLLLSDNLRWQDNRITRIQHCVHQVGSSCGQVQGQLSWQVKRLLGLKQVQVTKQEQKQELILEQFQEQMHVLALLLALGQVQELAQEQTQRQMTQMLGQQVGLELAQL